MSQEMANSAVLMLRPHARIVQTGGELIVEDVEGEYRFSGRAASILRAVRYHLDGTREVADIVRDCCIPPADLAATLGTLIVDEVIVDVGPLLTATCPREFLRRYFPLCDTWGRLIFAWPFWETLVSGRASPSQVLGWGVQFFHRVVGADQHNALALHYCTDARLRGWLEEHFREEAQTAMQQGAASAARSPMLWLRIWTLISDSATRSLPAPAPARRNCWFHWVSMREVKLAPEHVDCHSDRLI